MVIPNTALRGSGLAGSQRWIELADFADYLQRKLCSAMPIFTGRHHSIFSAYPIGSQRT
jgi:hypothetical protein